MKVDLRVVNINMKVYVPANLDWTDVIELLNDKLYTDPEFFGEFDYGTVELTDIVEEY